MINLKILPLLFLFFSFICLSACGNDKLTRDKVKSLIEGNNHSPVVMWMNDNLNKNDPSIAYNVLGCSTRRYMKQKVKGAYRDATEKLNFSGRKGYLQYLDQLSSKGFLEVMSLPAYVSGKRENNILVCKFNEEALGDLIVHIHSEGDDKESIYALKLADPKIEEVTGLKFSNDNNATANFTFRDIETSLSKDIPNKSFMSNDLKEGLVTLSLYDDGWRIDNIVLN